MLKCRNCGEVFDSDEVVRVKDDPSPSGVSLTSGYYEYWECPHCGSDDIVEAEQCNICGEWFAEDEGETICENCQKELLEELERIREKYDLDEDEFGNAIEDAYGW